MIGRYRVEGNTVSDTWNELEDYIARSMEYIRGIHPYSESELLNKHEIDFFRILNRVDQLMADKRAKAEERKARLSKRR